MVMSLGSVWPVVRARTACTLTHTNTHTRTQDLTTVSPHIKHTTVSPHIKHTMQAAQNTRTASMEHTVNRQEIDMSMNTCAKQPTCKSAINLALPPG